MENYFKLFKLKIFEIEYYPSTSTEIELPKVNKPKFTRYHLSLLSLDNYGKERTEEMIKCKRFMTAKNATPNEINTAGLMIENQIEIFSIIKKEELIRKEIEKK